MAITKRWDLNVSGYIYAVTYEPAGFGKQPTLDVNGTLIPIEKQHRKPFIGIERPFYIGDKEFVLTVIGNTADIAVDGYYIDTQKPYVPFQPIPWWNWIFVAICVAIPIVALGGAIPAMLGIVGTSLCTRTSATPSYSVSRKLITCIAISVAAWALFILMLVMTSLLMGH